MFFAMYQYNLGSAIAVKLACARVAYITIQNKWTDDEIELYLYSGVFIQCHKINFLFQLTVHILRNLLPLATIGCMF